MGLPGDSLSASRFVRATVLAQGIGQLPATGEGWRPAPGAFPTPPPKSPPGFASSEQTSGLV